MEKHQKTPDKKFNLSDPRNYYIILAVCVVIYLTLSMTAPVDSAIEQYGISATQVHLLQLTVFVPLVLIWWVAFYAAIKLKKYTQKIKNSDEHAAFNLLANGLLVMAASLAINGVVGGLRNFAIEGGNIAPYRIVANYIEILLPLVGLVLVFLGSIKLLKFIKTKYSYLLWVYVVVAVLLVVASYLQFNIIMDNPYRNFSPDPETYRSFYLSDNLIVTTILVPYYLTWLIGTITSINMLLYSFKAKGLIYKRFFRLFGMGLIAVISFSILMQLITMLVAAEALNLQAILLLVYGLLILMASGYLLAALGVKKLIKLEQAV